MSQCKVETVVHRRTMLTDELWRRNHLVRTFVFFLAAVATAAQSSNLSYVDPFIGIEHGGDTTPGPSVPFGMVKPGPDTGTNEENSGWGPTGDINGFSQTHVSGTGGGASYGNILVQPTTGDPVAKGFSSPRANETGSLAYYAVDLRRYGIHVEVTTAAKAALYRFTYPEAKTANLLFDMGHALASSADAWENQIVTDTDFEVVTETEVRGSSSVKGGWNKQPVPYRVFFYASTDAPVQSFGTWRDGELHSGNRKEQTHERHTSGGWLSFSTRRQRVVMLRIGISFISAEQARQNAVSAIPTLDFEATRSTALRLWDQAAGRIQVEGGTEEQRKSFYTALYHAMLLPVDRTGENPLWQSSEPYYDDYYAIWDTFRSNNPLLTLIAPERESAIVRALIDLYRHEKWLPDARQGNYNGRTQGGSNADIVIADAYAKGMTGIDWETAYRAVVNDAERSPWDQFKEGRGGLQDWKSRGYLSVESVDRPGSKQMEYAADDFAVATLAKGLGRRADFEKYAGRSRHWEKLWDANFSDEGFSGFIRPVHDDGSWLTPFSAKQGCSFYGDSFYEGDTWTYSLYVPQDTRQLIEKSGGKERFVARLDQFFKGQHFDVTNEPGFLTPYLYIWAGRYDKTAERVRKITVDSFKPTRGGLPGNDDSGAMSSWYMFSAMGIFPNAGQDVYLIGSPLFRKVRIELPNGKTFLIEAKDVSDNNRYVIAAELNGKPLRTAWFRHTEIKDGGSLILRMADRPGAWPSGDPPPSLSDPQRSEP